jgi:hypothetical protein
MGPEAAENNLVTMIPSIGGSNNVMN